MLSTEGMVEANDLSLVSSKDDGEDCADFVPPPLGRRPLSLLARRLRRNIPEVASRGGRPREQQLHWVPK